MKTAVIIQDPDGYRSRVAALESVHDNVYSVASATRPNDHSLSIHVPMDWLPSSPDLPYNYKCWLKCEAMAVRAILEHNIIADYYWIIESDAVASQERWKALFADWENIEADCVSQPFRLRINTPDILWWKSPSTPAWTEGHMLISCYRLSRKAVLELARCATEMREVISEITVPSVLMRANMKMVNVNQKQSHWNSQTMKTHEYKVIPNANLVNHPIKTNSFDVPACLFPSKT